MRRFIQVLCFEGMALAVLATSAPAQVTSTWIAPASGPYEFGDPTHWDLGVPGTSDTGLIVPPVSVTIEAAGSVTTSTPVPGGPTHYEATRKTGNLRIAGETVTFEDGALQAKGPAGWVVNIGGGSGGSLVIRDFDLLNEWVAVVGGGTGEFGSALITGPHATWRANTNESGGWFAVGALGHGEVTVADGGFISSGAVPLGDFFSGPGGNVHVTGVGSQWDMREFRIGHRGGTNLAQVDLGGRVVVEDWVVLGALYQPDGSIDPESTGALEVRNPGSTLVVTDGEMGVGRQTSGTILIEDGGEIEVFAVTKLAVFPGSSGSALIKGQGSKLTTGVTGGNGLIVGGNGMGAMVIEAGGQCDAKLSEIFVAPWEQGVGHLTVKGSGSGLVGGNLQIGNTLGNPASSGSVLIADGALVELELPFSKVHANGTLTLDMGMLAVGTSAPGPLLNEGTVEGAGVIFGEVSNEALLSPGVGIGTLTVTDDLTLSPSSIVEIELGQGALAGQFDKLIVGDEVVFGGTLRLVSTGGFVPQVGHAFDFLTAVTASGSFDAIEVPGDFPAHVTFESGVATVTIDPYPWSDEGCALPGVFSDPHLVGTGPLSAGSSNAVDLADAAHSATAALFIAGSSTPIPFKAGTLKANPFFEPLVLSTDFFGEISLPFVMPPGYPAGTEVWVQFAIVDSFAPLGVSLSNAIRGTTP